MVEHRNYSRSPIVEAIINIQVRLPDSVGLPQLERFHDAEKVGYPTKKRLLQTEWQGQVDAGQKVSTSVSQRQPGFRFDSGDGRQVVQTRLQGFAFSRLAPYQNWELFRDEGRRLWEHYEEIATPETITRMAVRYINRFDFPTPMGEFSEYLRTFPEVSSDLPQGVAGYLMRVQIPYEKVQGLLILTTALAQPQRDNVVSIILDLDLFRESEMATSRGTDAQIWDILESLHSTMNGIFEGCITDKTRGLIA